MLIADAFFYLFATTCVAAGFMVISARNPVHAVLFLILAFINAAGLFILLGAEFLALILVVVYVGAVAVLFLFVVMMLDVDFSEMRAGFLSYLPIGALIGIILLVELILVFGSWVITPEIAAHITTPIPPMNEVSNIEAIGQVMYTKYIYFFEAAGVILLIAMIGAIVLTLHHKEGIKRQSIATQVGRTRDESIEIRHVEPGQGL
jgi:NADH-quinone oxidoreductase subunit J